MGSWASEARSLFISGLPAAHSARKFLANLPDWMSLSALAMRFLVAALTIFWTGVVVAELSGVGDGVTHVAQATLHHQVNNELHFVQTFK